MAYRDRLRERLLQREKIAKGVLVFHNSKGDLDFGDNLGINLVGNTSYCTMRMAHLIREEYPFRKSLDVCYKHYCKGKGKTPLDFTSIGWGNVPSESMYEYAANDASITLDLFNVLKPLFDAEQLEEVWQSKREVINIYRKMESRGVKIDTDLCKQMYELGTDEMADLARTLGVNPASPLGLKKILIDELRLPIVKRTPTGRPCFDKESMQHYDRLLEHSTDATALLILAYRGWQKSTSSNYGPYLSLLSPDGRLRPNYKLHGTKTGRASCEKPNLQQIPKVSNKPWNGKMKNAFIPKDGYTLIEFDYSQLELRLATAYAQEKTLMDVFHQGRDIFTEMSEELGMSRNDTKTLVYTIQYGGGLRRISTVFGVSESRASELREGFFQAYSGFRVATKTASGRAKSKGKVKLWSGRYRHFEYPAEQSHKAFNAVIQGGAADIVDHSQRRIIARSLDVRDECEMLLQVHDSLVFEIRTDLLNTYVPEIKEAMEQVEPDFGVKFAVDFHEWGK
jgi:DNA polymerase I